MFSIKHYIHKKNIMRLDIRLHTQQYDINNPLPCQTGEFDIDGNLLPLIWSN